jgi:hypothetical protein
MSSPPVTPEMLGAYFATNPIARKAAIAGMSQEELILILLEEDEWMKQRLRDLYTHLAVPMKFNC